MDSTNVGDSVVWQTEKPEQKYSEMPTTEVKACIFVKDNKSTQWKPKYKYIDERPSCIPPTIHGQSLPYQWKKKGGIFPSCRSSSYDTVREVPNAPHQAEDLSNELERSNKSKHHARYVQENKAKAPHRTATELNVNNHKLPTHLISSKHLQSSAEFQTLKDKTNVVAINKTAAAASHSNPVTWRIKELIEIDKSKYEASKKELEQLKQNFQDLIRQFVPTNELQNGIKGSNLTQVSLVLEENEKIPSLSSDNHMKSNSDFKITDARLYLSEDKTCCPSLSIENKGDQVDDSNLRLEMFSIPKSELATRVLPIEKSCIAQENLELLSFNVPKEKKEPQELEQALPKLNLIIIDESGIQKLHSPGKIEQQKIELMFNVEEKRDCSKQVKSKADDDLNGGLSKNESETLALESTIEEKENQINELKQHIHDMQVEKNNILLWDINLMCKVQEAKNEGRQYNSYVADYVSINEKLIVLLQRKEEEAMFLSEQVARLHMVLSKMTEENKSMFEALQKVAKEMTNLREQNIILEQHCDLMKLKLQNSETELQKREELMETISQQVVALFQNQDSLLAEAEQLRSQLQDAKYKQVQIESELIYSNNVVNDLKEKICHRDDEMSRLRAEMKQIMKQNVLFKQKEAAKDQDLLNLQNKMANLLHKVQALEEEVMEKEGQISILKRSFSDEFDY